MNLHQYTGIGRPIDFRYPTNKAIAVLSAVALVGGVVMGAVQGLVFGKILLLGLYFAVTVFLAWAFTREVDPHHPYSAFATVALVAGAFVWGIRPDLLSIAVMMGTARMLIGSCGRRASLLDMGMIAGGAAWLVFGQHQLVTAIIIAFVFLLNGLLKPRYWPSFIFAAIVLVTAVTGFFLYPPIPSIGDGLLDSKFLVLGLFVLYIFLAYKRPEAPADSNDSTIGRRRLLAFHILLVVWMLLSLPLYGQGAINKYFLVWGTMAAVSLYALVIGIFRRKAGNV